MNSTLRKLALLPTFLVMVVGVGLLMRGNTSSQASAAGKQDPPAAGTSKGSDAAKAADRAIPRLLGDAIARRRRREGRAAIKQVADPRDQITVREAQEILDKELARLPDKFRVPLVLCYLEGLTRDEAAKQLGVPPSTLKGRLEQARERLRARLASPGLAVAGALVASIFSEGTASSALPSVLLDSTVEAAKTVVSGGTTASAVPAQVAALAKGVIKAMFMTKVKIGLAVLVALAGFGGAARLGRWTGASRSRAASVDRTTTRCGAKA